MADGIAERSGDVIRVTEAGRPLVRLVAAVFDAYLQTGKGRHSESPFNMRSPLQTQI